MLRSVMFLGISILLHVMVLSMPWNVLGSPSSIKTSEQLIPVGLVERHWIKGMARAGKTTEGISFDVKGRLSADYIEQMKARIFNAWVYPKKAIDKGYYGVSLISFNLDGMGNVLGLRVVRSSGHTILDRAAMDAVMAAAPFGPRTEDTGPGRLMIKASFRYVLE